MREIRATEVFKLKECLSELAEHHNRVSMNFKGNYPKEAFDQTLERFAADLEAGESHIAVIENGDRVIGFCKVNCSQGVGTLEYMVVRNSQRGKGYGARLMNWAMDKLREAGVAFVEVKVVDGNEAIRFYEKYGFKMNAHLLRLRI